MTPQELAADSYGCWLLATLAQREIAIRKARISPKDARERQWAEEGPVAHQSLSTVTAEPAT